MNTTESLAKDRTTLRASFFDSDQVRPPVEQIDPVLAAKVDLFARMTLANRSSSSAALERAYSDVLKLSQIGISNRAPSSISELIQRIGIFLQNLFLLPYRIRTLSSDQLLDKLVVRQAELEQRREARQARLKQRREARQAGLKQPKSGIPRSASDDEAPSSGSEPDSDYSKSSYDISTFGAVPESDSD